MSLIKGTSVKNHLIFAQYFSIWYFAVLDKEKRRARLLLSTTCQFIICPIHTRVTLYNNSKNTRVTLLQLFSGRFVNIRNVFFPRIADKDKKSRVIPLLTVGAQKDDCSRLYYRYSDRQRRHVCRAISRVVVDDMFPSFFLSISFSLSLSLLDKEEKQSHGKLQGIKLKLRRPWDSAGKALVRLHTWGNRISLTPWPPCLRNGVPLTRE